MKISNRNNPVLEMLYKESLHKMKFDNHIDEDFLTAEFSKPLLKRWENNCTVFKENIIIVTDPFFEAVSKNLKKLDVLAQDITDCKVDFKLAGTYIFKEKVIFSYFEVKKDNMEPNFMCYLFSKQGHPMFFYAKTPGQKEDEDEAWIKYSILMDYSIDSGLKDFSEVKKNLDKTFSVALKDLFNKAMGSVIMIELFRRYAEVEEKTLPPNKVLKDINCKYVNDTRLNISILDSKWFTTLIKSDSFNVRGHFRWQPYGEGLSRKKIIWIDEFEKTGYTAPARKLT